MYFLMHGWPVRKLPSQCTCFFRFGEKLTIHW
uniref:Uncharacterized protein n=1 Tax=Rhizophora mucronata TaxID=61149 RepID=A0A2P2PAP5_RHIMU